jgi:GNAT superfamily N-acetyltransferase
MRAFGVLPGWSRRRVIEMLIADVVFVAREEGRLAGYVAVGVGAPDATVEQLVLAAGHERFELGDGLVAQARRFALAENVRALHVEAREADWTARSFYERCGFVPVGGDVLELVLPGPGEA